MDALFLIGRLLFSMLFLASGIGHLTHPSSAEYAAAKGVPSPRAAVLLSGVMIILGGLSVLLWRWVDVGAWLLVIFLFATSFMMHAFWKEETPAAKQMEMANFMKNMSLAGAAIIFYVFYRLPLLAL